MVSEVPLELQFPDVVVSRIANSAVSQNAKLSKGALKAINRCSTLFSIYLASLSASSKNSKKSLVQDEDVRSAIKFINSLG
ncbi:Histone-like transcription factor (CBF/NF-Y) [Cryptosporidium felis]|nr:Histone-like transcription factor (CBF/NF-Y) [Cryptosporidium felis]